MSTIDRADYTALSDRMAALLILRVALAGMVIGWAALRPDVLGVPFETLALVSLSYVGMAVLAEYARRRSVSHGFALLTAVLLLDGLYLAGAMYMTGGTQSPIRFLLYLHLVAVSLLASYRTGLKLALWDSLLLIVVLYAQAAMLVPAVDVQPGVAIEFEHMPVLYVTSFWLFALATSVF
jgi:two-component system cell cycle response regulator